jgi:hypothetical protein
VPDLGIEDAFDDYERARALDEARRPLAVDAPVVLERADDDQAFIH